MSEYAVRHSDEPPSKLIVRSADLAFSSLGDSVAGNMPRTTYIIRPSSHVKAAWVDANTYGCLFLLSFQHVDRLAAASLHRVRPLEAISVHQVRALPGEYPN